MIYNPKNNPFIDELNMIENEREEQVVLVINKLQPIQAKVKTAKEMMEEFFKTNYEEN
jgi:hypothetical protein